MNRLGIENWIHASRMLNRSHSLERRGWKFSLQEVDIINYSKPLGRFLKGGQCLNIIHWTSIKAHKKLHAKKHSYCNNHSVKETHSALRVATFFLTMNKLQGSVRWHFCTRTPTIYLVRSTVWGRNGSVLKAPACQSLGRVIESDLHVLLGKALHPCPKTGM